MSILSHLEQLDMKLMVLLSDEMNSLNVDEMERLIYERRQCLIEIKMSSEVLNKELWNIALNRSQDIYSQIKKHRDNAAIEAGRFLKGRRSINIYKKFE